MKNANLICDLQFGSTGKGLIAGYLAQYVDKPDVIVTAWSANAGHTYIDKKGIKYTHTMLANGVVSPNLKYILIGPGSLISLIKLFQECMNCRHLLRDKMILIHENAAVISDRHIRIENGSMIGIGSTKKGCGAAMIEKITRQVDNRIILAGHFRHKIHDMASMRGLVVKVIGNKIYNATIDRAKKIQVEGAQGFSIGINSGFYPYVTSRECTPAQIMSDCGIPLDRLNKVIGCMRTFPIRVANRYNEESRMVGYSGPCYPDQEETTFEAIGVEPEFTTVTKLPRRVFTFSPMQCTEALRACCPDEVFLNFINYVVEEAQTAFIEDIANETGNKLRYLGNGPSANDVHDMLKGVQK